MPSWLSDLVGTDMARPAYYALAATIVLALIFVVLWITRKVLGASIGPRAKGRGPRLAVMDVTAIDPKRKLVLVRRDEVEHLLLIGGQNDLIVEAGILRVPANARTARTDPALRLEPDAGDMGGRPMLPSVAATQPPMRQPAPAARTTPMPTPTVRGPQRLAEPRATSPLTRQVPRPAAPQGGSVGGELNGEGGVRVPGGRQAPTTEPNGEPTVAVEPPRVEQGRRDPDLVPELSSRTDDATLETLQQDESEAPAVRSPVAAPPPIPAERIEPRFAHSNSAASARTSSRSAVIPVSSIAPASSTADEPGGGTTDPAPERPARPSGLPVPPMRPAASIARIAVGGGSDPVRRPLPAQTAQPIQPRSTATLIGSGRALPLMSQNGTEPPPSPAAGHHAPDVAPPERGAAPRPGQPSEGAMLTSLLAAAPASGAALGSSRDPGRNTQMSPGPSAPSRSDPGRLRDTAPVPSAPVAEGRVAASDDEETEKRPLSVRSFATSIQARKVSQEAPSETPATETRPAERTNGEPVRPAPQSAMPTAPLVTVPSPAPRPSAGAPAPAPARAVSDGDDLEAFLAAQLDSDFSDEGTSAQDTERRPVPEIAPPVRPDPRPLALEPEPAEVQPKRQLTLEEEMERLLGDFDFETSDRKKP